MSRQPTSFKITWSKDPLSAIACSNKLSRVLHVCKQNNTKILLQGHRLFLLFKLSHTDILLALNISECKQRIN